MPWLGLPFLYLAALLNAAMIVCVFGFLHSTQPTGNPDAPSYHIVSHGRTALPSSSSTKQSIWWWSPNHTSFTCSGLARIAIGMQSSFSAFRPRRASVASSFGIAPRIRSIVCRHSGTSRPAPVGKGQGG